MCPTAAKKDVCLWNQHGCCERAFDTDFRTCAACVRPSGDALFLLSTHAALHIVTIGEHGKFHDEHLKLDQVPVLSEGLTTPLTPGGERAARTEANA